jgi:hypothetical protein
VKIRRLITKNSGHLSCSADARNTLGPKIVTLAGSCAAEASKLPPVNVSQIL